MLSLFLVVYFSGHLGAAVGPLPYGMDECLVRKAGIDREWDQNWVKRDLDHAPQMVDPITHRHLKRSDIVTACEWHELNPVAEQRI